MIDEKKKTAESWFRQIRNEICKEFELIDGEGKFERKNWQRDGGGGGEISIMRGKVFEKVGVNVSTVYGQFSEKFRKEIPGAEHDGKFWASGVSLVAHMQSPLVPAVHMNTRFIVTSKSWFGGGADLTPIYPNEQDSNDFHNGLKAMCDKHNHEYYSKFSKWADEYFFLPHRNEPRGIGGIFFDYLDSGDWDKDYNFVQDLGKSFLTIYSEIVKRNKDKIWTKQQREFQLERRGRYVEFNLLFDRGIRFGVMTGGNVEAYMMSMPPEVSWK